MFRRKQHVYVKDLNAMKSVGRKMDEYGVKHHFVLDRINKMHIVNFVRNENVHDFLLDTGLMSFNGWI